MSNILVENVNYEHSSHPSSTERLDKKEQISFSKRNSVDDEDASSEIMEVDNTKIMKKESVK